jgi:hypothetical protein
MARDAIAGAGQVFAFGDERIVGLRRGRHACQASQQHERH